MNNDERAARANPDSPRNTLDQALAAHRDGDLERAHALYMALVEADPEHVDALHMLGVLANQLGDPATACDLIGRAIALRPDLEQFQYNYGVVLQAAGRLAAAVAAYARARAHQPARAAICENLGTALHDLGRTDEAVDAWEEALRLDARSAIAHKNLGTHRFNGGDTDAARRHFETLLALDPVSAEAQEKLATALLRGGDFERGWEAWEWRFASPSFVEKNPPAYAPYAKWAGADLAGKTVLVSAEQGVGDEVLFSGQFAELARRGARCVIECDARLAPLFRRSFEGALVVARGEIPDDLAIDLRIAAGSLPRLLNWRPPSAPPAPWLIPDTNAVHRWRDALDDGGRPLTIGISWRGGGDARAQRARSIALSHWRALVDLPGVRVINLQYGEHDEEIAAFNAGGDAPLECLLGVDPLRDLDELSAVIAALDLVITVDNTTAHLAGAVGTPTRVLLPPGPDWRWQDGQDRSAWYPDVRLLRRSASGDGRGVLASLVEEVSSGSLHRRFDDDTAPRAAFPPVRAPRASGGTRWVLINDTTNWYHWGCTATSLGLHHALRERGRVMASLPIWAVGALPGVPQDPDGFADRAVFERFRRTLPQLIDALGDADAICINGEGSLHRLSPLAVNLLYLAQICAVHLDKPVHIVNHSCYPDGGAEPSDPVATELYRSVYANLAHVAVREDVSAAGLRRLGIDVTDAFDCLPLYVERQWQPSPALTRDYVLLAGSAQWAPEAVNALPGLVSRLRGAGVAVRILLGANAYPAVDDLQFARVLHQACGDAVDLQWTHSESDWLNAIAGARLLVSGRFHHSIAAAFVDTPFLVAQSNTPKIDGLLARLDLRNALPRCAEPEAQADSLWHAAKARLDLPDAFLLDTDRRAELLGLARQNVAGPAAAYSSAKPASASRLRARANSASSS